MIFTLPLSILVTESRFSTIRISHSESSLMPVIIFTFCYSVMLLPFSSRVQPLS